MLISKKGKPNEDPSSYRPLCMLATVWEILERVLVTRLEKALTNAGGLSPNQHGFCRRKSTIDGTERVHQTAREVIKVDRWMYGTKEYCLVLTIDVKNAFNSANWSRIMSSLRSFRVPRYRVPRFNSKLFPRKSSLI